MRVPCRCGSRRVKGAVQNGALPSRGEASCGPQTLRRPGRVRERERALDPQLRMARLQQPSTIRPRVPCRIGRRRVRGGAGRSAAVRRRGELRAANPESAGPRAQARARARPVATAGTAADNGRRKCHPRCKQLCQPDPCLSTHTHTHTLVGVRVAPKLTLSRIV